jgi:hypothetical protein
MAAPLDTCPSSSLSPGLVPLEAATSGQSKRCHYQKQAQISLQHMRLQY